MYRHWKEDAICLKILKISALKISAKFGTPNTHWRNFLNGIERYFVIVKLPHTNEEESNVHSLKVGGGREILHLLRGVRSLLLKE
jgi:hypothetical protein